MSGDLRASQASPKGLAPLRLGSGDTPVCEAREVVPGPKGQATLVLEQLPGKPTLRLSKRGAASLAEWLWTWAQPRSKVTLWGIQGIAQECGVSRRTAYDWVGRDDFPQPVPTVGVNGQVWEARAVKAWRRHTRRPGGRPRKREARG